MSEDVRYNRARRRAQRRGLELRKSGRRDPQALDFGLYQLFDAETGEMMFKPSRDGFTFCASLSDVEAFLDGEVPVGSRPKQFRVTADAEAQ